MASKRQPDETRKALVDAAKRLLRMRGTSLSLDAVAREAGISKGGLLHHFPTREELLAGVLDDLMTDLRRRLEAKQQEEIAAVGASAGSWLRAYIDLSFRSEEGDQILFAALAPLIGMQSNEVEADGGPGYIITKTEADGIETGRAHAVRLTCDSVWLSRNSGLPVLSEDRRMALRNQLLDWTRS